MKRKFEYEQVLKEIEEAKENLAHKEMNFNNASNEFFEIANMELSMAKTQLDVCLRKARLMRD